MIVSLDAHRLAQGGDVVEGEEVCVVGQPAHPEYHHQHDEHLHNLKVAGKQEVAKMEVAKCKIQGYSRVSLY